MTFSELAEKEAAYNRTRLTNWRDELPHDEPTAWTVVTCAIDPTEHSAGRYDLILCHVRTFRGNIDGRGFMARLVYKETDRWEPGRFAANGKFCETMEEALKEGKTLLANRVQDDAAYVEKVLAEHRKMKEDERI